MKRLVVLVFFVMFASNFVVAGENFFEMPDGILTQSQIENISSSLESIYNENEIVIKIQFPVSSFSEDSEEFWSNYVRDEFFRQELDSKANPLLNLLVVFRLDSAGELSLNIGFSEGCGWDSEKLSRVIEKKQGNYSLGYYEYVIGIIEILKEEILSTNSFSLSCELPGYIESKCQNLFLESAKSNNYKSVLVIPADYNGKSIDIKNMISEVVLGLRVNSVWSRNFEKINFIYYNEIQKIDDKCDSYDDFRCLSRAAFELQSLCSADQYIVFSGEDFRSYAFSGQGVFLSTPYSRKDFEFKEDFFAYFRKKSGSLIHELGHSLFCLSDEYVEMVNGSFDFSRDEPEYPNCASSISEAESWWGNLVGQSNIGYYDGCAYVPGNFKPHKKSSMSNSAIAEYGLVNDAHIENVFSGVSEC